ncbi:helix-turn-helix transcriptional regulator [Nocardia sp. NPDC050697]|uniref:helix-turn-helix domain-containing protein n=1 Tax=Nocardia sp. NPDC050697 TaxID=3155158 RepID=UPI0034117F99
MHIITGEVIRRVRRSLGMTQTELGAILGYTQPAISQLERGGAGVHDVRVLRRVARALHVPLSILVVESDEEADVDRRNFFRAGALGAAGAAGAGSPAQAVPPADIRVGASDVAAINASLNQIHELDLIVGGDRLCRTAANEVRYVQHLLASGTYSEETGRALASAGAEMMTAAGWVHYDAGRIDDARHYYADAAQSATAAGDGIAGAHALLNAGIVAFREGNRPRDGVNLTQAAQRSAARHGGPRLRALCAIREAEAQGAVNDTSSMAGAVSRAHRAYDSTRGHDPEWVYLPEAELTGLIGLAFTRAGDFRQADAHLRAAVDSSTAWPREHWHWQVHLAQNYLAAGDVAASCALLSANLHTFKGLASTRLDADIEKVAQAVQPLYKVPEVKEFLELRAAGV